MSESNALSPEKTRLVGRFESRATWLMAQAYFFLFLMILLLAFGGYIVFQAPNLTSVDIGGTSLATRLNNTQAELADLITKTNSIAGAEMTKALKDCKSDYGDLVPEFHPPDVHPSGNAFHAISFERHLPSGDELASEIERLLKSEDVQGQTLIGVQYAIVPCGLNLFQIFSRDKLQQFSTELRGKDVKFDRSRANELMQIQDTNQAKISFLQQVVHSLYSHLVEQQALGSATDPDSDVGTTKGNSTQTLRLIQTTITRFGILALVGFFVSILLPLYRYNVRLAGFYRARADALLMINADIKQAVAKSFSDMLTPNLEFGKTPATPVEQIINLAHALKGMGKPSDDG